MVAVKARHGVREMRSGSGAVKVGMTLGATGVRSFGQLQMAAMFFVARRAIWGEELIDMMDRRVMARLAALIVGFGAEHAGLFHGAGATLGGGYGVRGRNPSPGVDVIAASKGIPAEPQDCRQRRGHGQNGAQ